MALTQWVRQLRLENFRNIEGMSLDLSPRLNVLAGDNGQGKTSVLEGLYLLATSRSFRTDRIREVRRDGSDLTVVMGLFVEDGIERRQRVAITARERSFVIDGRPPESLSQYAQRTPVVVFHPGDLELVSGPASLRRRLLDRVALFSDPSAAEARLGHQRASKERQALLQSRGLAGPELDVFERLVAKHGVALAAARQRAAGLLETALLPAFQALAAVELELRLAYEPGGSDDEEVYVRELFARRESDRRRKWSDYGPSRDDLVLEINGRPARQKASQGQQRVLTLALKAAELVCIREARGVEPLLLLDDVSSELDPSRVGAVYEFVRSSRGQVLVTTTRPDLFVLPDQGELQRRDFVLRSGALETSQNHA